MAHLPPFVRLALAILLQIQLVASSSFVATARPEITIMAHAAASVTTCDGGHGFFTCYLGSCFYDNTGAFACCYGTDSCVPITTCIPFGSEASGKTCSGRASACLSCRDSIQGSCKTFTNPAMKHRAVVCARTGGIVSSSFLFDMAHMTDSAPSSHAPSTLVGAPLEGSSDTAAPPSTSTLSFASSTTSGASTASLPNTSTSGGGTAPIATHVPTFDEGPQNQLPGPTIGGIAVGSIAGAFLLTVALFFLYKWYKIRQLNRDSGAGGVLPGPRKKAKKSKKDAGNDNGSGGGAVNELDTAPGSSVNELDGGNNGHVRRSTPTFSREGRNWSPAPPPTPVVFGPLSLPSQQSYWRPQSTNGGAIMGPVLRGIIEARSSSNSDPSPPFTPTPTPMSPIFPSTSPTFDPSQRPMSIATLYPPNSEEETYRKSSALLPIAGPYLTAERALGEGYWEAEREQAEADRAMLEREDGSRKVSRDEGIEDQENTLVWGDDSRVDSEGSTGTVVRRNGRK
ncbi:hypothetical protein K505DRAFT_372388 [Melanomma pulvis-pyrius CBS 109.77]|uniref:Mid2 domain-containing protein n=1 Tax=Melanomma pulvis-pyrius CBS 109.77 TaxID=1314802 RepID=A0A6A6XNM2_9PLEO|nr:hypothetical protein K505DRAFT_372388 [Melanomma pulvis-pyrius CBS 109.77]